MAYTPTEWVCGDIITAEKLNKLENGLADCCGGSAPLVVSVNSMTEAGQTVYILDKTWREIYDACPNVCFLEEYPEIGAYGKFATLKQVECTPTPDGNVYRVEATIPSIDYELPSVFQTDSVDGYPQLNGGK